MALISSSPTQTSPSLGWSRPAIRLSSVVLPEPDGPIRARYSPSGTSRLRSISTSICSLPRRKYLCRPLTRTIGSVMAFATPRRAGGVNPPVKWNRRVHTPRSPTELLLERDDDAHVRLEIRPLLFGRNLAGVQL